jgi:hypothetical protein
MQRLAIIALVAAVTSTFAGCKLGGGQNTSAVIRYKIFEAPATLVDRIVPAVNRAPIEGSTYLLAQGTQADLTALQDGMVTGSGLLVDHSRRIYFWPKQADAWTYAWSDEKSVGWGTGAGFLGVRSKGRRHEIRIEYRVGHDINSREPIQSKLTYEGPLSNSVLIALMPFQRTDGEAVVHVIAFQADGWR